MAFPLNDQNQLLSQQAIMAGVAGTQGGSGVLRVSSLSSQMGGFNYSYITTSGGNQTLKTGAGVLHTVVVGVSSLTSSVTFYDNSTSAVANTIGYIVSGTNRQAFLYDAQFATGLTVSVGSVLDTITFTYL